MDYRFTVLNLFESMVWPSVSILMIEIELINIFLNDYFPYNYIIKCIIQALNNYIQYTVYTCSYRQLIVLIEGLVVVYRVFSLHIIAPHNIYFGSCFCWVQVPFSI